MKIRTEKYEDYFTVESLIKRAFWNVNTPGCNEHYIAHCIRKHSDFIPELSLVLETDQKIIASVMYTKSSLVDEQGCQKKILTFGPFAVEPTYQRKGYGKALLEKSFELAKVMGYDTIVIFGHPGNYVSRGFKSCKKYNVCLSEQMFPAAMLVKVLRENALDGRLWHYQESEAFQCNMSKYDEFDKNFEQYTPEEKPCQEEFYILSHARIFE